MISSLLSSWTYALAAAVFATVMLWQLRGGARGAGQRWLLAGLFVTTIWAWLCAVAPGSMLAAHAETARNFVWIAVLHSLSATGDEEVPQLHGVRLVYAAVAAGLALQFVVDSLPLWVVDRNGSIAATAMVLRMTTAAGSLVLVHNLYGQAAPVSRVSIRLATVALAMGWVYDLNLYTVAYLGGAPAAALFEWRGAILLATAPLFAMGGQRADGWRIRLSRAATFQSLSLLAICSYLALTAVLASVLRGTDWDWARGLTIALLSAMTVAVLVLLPSSRARRWTKVKIAKHFFEHRYDYRSEWLRFTATLGGGDKASAPLGERVIQAFADILDAPAGLLLATDEQGSRTLAAVWNWAAALPTGPQLAQVTSDMWSPLTCGRVLELDTLRHGTAASRDMAVPVAGWLIDEPLYWIGIPLLHNGRLVGLVLLAAPEARRALDWEDFDLLRTAGRQAASSLAEAHGQQALMNAQRFEEFNRRFAFILHDVKNLVSQLSLLTRNAERHADNPEFRADMVETLRSSVGKMNDLLTRLAPNGETMSVPRARQFSLLPVLSAAIAAKRSQRDVRLLGAASIEVIGDAASLEQAVGHLLQNAIEASQSEAPVLVRVSAAESDRVSIDIVDRGCGMDSDFVRNRLFQPFASTKAGGFGIGAFEARSLVHAMGGQLSVASKPGEGTRFTIHLPAAATAQGAATPTRKIA